MHLNARINNELIVMERLNTIQRIYKGLFLTAVLLFCFSFSYAQPPLPQRTLSVIATQSIHFGAFAITGGAGGTVTVGYAGSRTFSGSILLFSITPVSQPAVFEIKLCQGRQINITFDATTTLTGSNGGSLTLDLGPTEQGGNGASFSTNNDCNFITTLRMGGTLHVPGTAVTGTYTGSYNFTFNQE
jgi:hypothetical protein